MFNVTRASDPHLSYSLVLVWFHESPRTTETPLKQSGAQSKAQELNRHFPHSAAGHNGSAVD